MNKVTDSALKQLQKYCKNCNYKNFLSDVVKPLEIGHRAQTKSW